MNRGAVRLAATLALLRLLAMGDVAGAAERGAAVRKPAVYEADVAIGDPAEWTKRLVGRFRLDGSIHHEQEIIDHGSRDADPRGPFELWDVSLQGKSDCIDFTEAAGLQCVLNVSWEEIWRLTRQLPIGSVPDLTPGMLLAGLAPSAAPGTIRILEVDKRGLAHPGSVTLGGYTARTELPCVNMPGSQECEQIFRITAKPDSKLIFVTFTVRVRGVRSKSERKQLSPGERPTELLEERLTVSFSMRREPQTR